MIQPPIDERRAIAAGLGIAPCDGCPLVCPYCPRLLAARPDLRGVPAPAPPDWRPPEGPGLLRKAANLSVATVEHVAAGLPRVDDAAHEARLATCRSCVGPGGYFDAGTGTCRHGACGCDMEVKTWWAEQVCPIGKW